MSEADDAELDEALAADSALAAELAADLAVAAQLQSIAKVAPPAAVKQLVMDAIKGVAQDAGPVASNAQRRTLSHGLGGTLEVVWSPSAQTFVLAGSGISGLSDDETYQWWLIDTAGAVPVGIFRPDADGVVEQVFTDIDPTDFVVGVTVEPAGGTKQPTLPVVAAA